MVNEEKWKDFYTRHPDIFCEQQFGIKLHWWQKIMLRTIYKHNISKFIDRFFIVTEYLKNKKENKNV